jgi:hypothetical protein
MNASVYRRRTALIQRTSINNSDIISLFAVVAATTELLSTINTNHNNYCITISIINNHRGIPIVLRVKVTIALAGCSLL